MKPWLYDELSAQDRALVRETYVREQDGLCYHCKAPLDGPPAERIQKLRINLNQFPIGMLKHPVHLHHSRETGLTIGAVHARCNCVLWQYHGE